jgi:predicted DNA-binding transcriptional regulator AlpA
MNSPPITGQRERAGVEEVHLRMSRDWYSVHVEARAPAGATALGEDSADRLMELLEDHSGVVSGGRDSWSATVSVRDSSAQNAAADGADLIHEMAAQAGIPRWPVVRVEAILQDVVEEEVATPTLPDLVAVPEAAAILGVSQQRVHELVASTAFPKPVYELRTGRLWLKNAIEAYAERRVRKPGRPPKVAAAG